MFSRLFHRIGSGFRAACVALVGFIAVPLSASAAVDVTAVTGAFTDATTGVGAIAALMLGVVAAGIAVKWVLGFVIS